MNTGTKVALGVGLGFLVLVGSTVGYVVSSKFTGSTYEQSIFAQDESMQNTWAAVGKELKMAGFTVKSGSKLSLDKIKAQADRYKNDSGAMMKWITEAQPAASADLHAKFMDIISKGYAREESKQLSKISVVQEYRTWRTSTMKGTIGVMVFNFPSEKAKKIEDRIITTKEVKQTWETGEDEVSDPFAS